MSQPSVVTASRARRVCSAVLCAILLQGCTAQPSQPVSPGPVAPAQGGNTTPPANPSSIAVPASAAQDIAGSQPAPTDATLLARLREQLTAADGLYFGHDFSGARDAFLSAWEAFRPNPLALVMASHAARRAGDAASAKDLLSRARTEATSAERPAASPECAPGRRSAGRWFDHPLAGWFSIDGDWALSGTLIRVDLEEGRVLYALRDPTRDPGLEPRKAWTWAPNLVSAEWEQSETSDQGVARGTQIFLTDEITCQSVGALPHQVTHILYNDGYHGTLTFTLDGSLLASGSDAGIKLWRIADRRLLFALETKQIGWLEFSKDGKILVAATCAELMVLDVGSGKVLRTFQPPDMSCMGRLSSTVTGTAVSADRTLLAVGLELKTSGPTVLLYGIRDGKLVSQWQTTFAPEAFSVGARMLVGSAMGGSSSSELFDLALGKSRQIAEIPILAVAPTSTRLMLYDTVVLDWAKPHGVKPLPPGPSLQSMGPYLIPE